MEICEDDDDDDNDNDEAIYTYYIVGGCGRSGMQHAGSCAECCANRREGFGL